MRVRRLLPTLAIASIALGWHATPAAASPVSFADVFSVTITADENGHGTFTNTAGFFSALPFSLRGDAGPGGLSSALFYDMLDPPGLTEGDLVLLEPGTGQISDVIRFTVPTGTTGGFFFYSDTDDPVHALADTGLPTSFFTNTLRVTEVGPEGNNGFTYTPTAGQPGFVAGAAGPVTYVLISDSPAVPEPSTFLLLGTGVAALAVRMRRKTR